MANRAILYSTDKEKPEDLNRNDDIYYFDSRHSIPVAWFFFFREVSICSHDITFNQSSWKEIYLFSYKNDAITLYQSRISILIKLTNGLIKQDIALKICEVLKKYPGSKLLLNGSQVIEEEDHNLVSKQIAAILNSIENPFTTPEEFKKIIEPFNTHFWKKETNKIVQGIGCYYV